MSKDFKLPFKKNIDKNINKEINKICNIDKFYNDFKNYFINQWIFYFKNKSLVLYKENIKFRTNNSLENFNRFFKNNLNMKANMK